MITFYLINQTNGTVQDTELLRVSEKLLAWLDADVRKPWNLAKLQYHIKVLKSGQPVPVLDRAAFPVYLTAIEGLESTTVHYYLDRMLSMDVLKSKKSGTPWTATLGRLIVTTIINPTGQLAFGPFEHNDSSVFCALHVCLPCGGVTYQFEGIDVPDVTYPSFWSPDGVAPYDRCGVLTAPLSPYAENGAFDIYTLSSPALPTQITKEEGKFRLPTLTTLS